MEIRQKQKGLGKTRANAKDDEMPTDSLRPGITFVTKLSPVLVWHTLSSAIPAPRQVCKDTHDECITAEGHVHIRKHVSGVSITASVRKSDPKEMDDVESSRLTKWGLPEEHTPTKYFENSGYFDIPVHRDNIIIDTEVPREQATKTSHHIYLYSRSAKCMEQRSCKGQDSYRHDEQRNNRKHGGGKGETKLSDSEDMSAMAAPIKSCKDKHEGNSTAEEYVPVRQHVSDVLINSSVQLSEHKRIDAFGSKQLNEEMLQDEHSLITYCGASKHFDSPVHRDNFIIETEIPRRCHNNDPKSKQKKSAKLLTVNIDGSHNTGSNHATGTGNPEPTILPHKTQLLGNQHATSLPKSRPSVVPSPKEKPRVREKRKDLDKMDANIEDDMKCHVKYKRCAEQVEQRSCQDQYSERHDDKPRIDREHGEGKGATKLKELEDVSVIAAPRQVCKDEFEDNITAEEYAPARQHVLDVSISPSVQQSEPQKTDAIGITQLKEGLLPDEHSPTTYCDTSKIFNSPMHIDNLIIDTKVHGRCSRKDFRNTDSSPVSERKKPAILFDCNIDGPDIVEQTPTQGSGQKQNTVMSQDTQSLVNQHQTVRQNASQSVEAKPKEISHSREKRNDPDHCDANDKADVKDLLTYSRRAEHVEQRSYQVPYSDRHDESGKHRQPGSGKGTRQLNGSEDIPIMLALRQASKDTHSDSSIGEEQMITRELVSDVSNTDTVKKSEPKMTGAVGSIQLNEGILPEKHSTTTNCDTRTNFNSPGHRDKVIIDTEVPRRCRNNNSRNSYACTGSEQNKPANTFFDCKFVRSDNAESNSAPTTRKSEPPILTHNAQYLGNQHKLIGPNTSPPVATKHQKQSRCRKTRNDPDIDDRSDEDGVKNNLEYSSSIEKLEQRSRQGQDSDRHGETHKDRDLEGGLGAAKLNESEDTSVMAASNQVCRDKYDDDISAEDHILVRENVSYGSNTHTVEESKVKKRNEVGNIQLKELLLPEEHPPTTQCGKSNNFDSRKHTEEIHRKRPNDAARYNCASPVAEPKKPATLMDCIIDGSDYAESNPAPVARKSIPTVLPQITQFIRDQQTNDAHPPLVSKSKEKSQSWETSNYPDQDDANDNVNGHLIYCRSAANVEQRRYPVGSDLYKHDELHKRREPGDGEGKSKLKESACVPVMVGKIILLRISEYSSAPSGNVSVFLDEEQSNVVIRGVSQVDITAEKLRLYEHLENICESSEKLSVPMSLFMCQKEVIGHMQHICDQEQLKVVVHVTAKQQTLHCLAFTEDEADKGLTTIIGKLQTELVTLRQGQLDRFRGQKWSDFIQQFKGSLIMVYISEDNSRVIVEGFTSEAIETTKQKVKEFLKENVVRFTTNLELHGAEARCFQTCIQHSLEQTIRENHGDMKVEVLEDDYPLKLHVTVEGDDSVVKMTKNCLGKIWHETLDIRMVTDKELDVCLVEKGLSGNHGKPFLEKFQRENNCFIDVTEEGQPPSMAGTVEKARDHKPRLSPPDTQESHNAPVLYQRWSKDHKELKPSFGLSIYQPSAKTEEEAFQEAIERSTQDGQARDHQPRLSPPDTQESHNAPVQICQRWLKDHKELKPSFGLSIYQPSAKTEEEALQEAIERSTQDGQTNTQQQIVSPPDSHISHDYSMQRCPRHSEHHEELTPGFGLSIYQPSAKTEEEAFQEAIERSEQGGQLQPSQPDVDTCEEDTPSYRARNHHTRQYVGPRPLKIVLIQQTNGRQRVNKNMQYTTTICETKVMLKRGEIAKFQADCLVNIVGPSLDLDEGTVSKSFIRVGGQQLYTRFLNGQQYPLAGGVGTVILSKVGACGKLQCQSVCHVVLNKDVSSCSQIVQEAVSQVLAICSEQGYNSVAFPPLGAGRMFQYDASDVAQAMLQGTECFLAKHSGPLSSLREVVGEVGREVGRRFIQPLETLLQLRPTNFITKQKLNEVTFVIYDKDDDVFSTFERQMKALQSTQPSDLTQVLHQIQNKIVRPKQATRASQIPVRPKTSQSLHRRAPSREKKEVIHNRKFTPSDDVQEVHRTAGQDDVSRRGPTFQTDTPAKNLTVDVVAENQNTCLTAMTSLGQAIRNEFLFEDKVEKMAKVPQDAKVKIEAILTKHKVKSSSGKDGYIVKGQKDAVSYAIKDILQVFIDYGCSSERAVQEREQRTCRRRAQRETLEYVIFMVEEEPEVPRYWKNFRPGDPLKTAFTNYKSYGGKWTKVPLQPSDQVYKSIQQLINKTWDSSKRGQGQDARGLQWLSYNRMKVTQIDRIENLDLYHEYVQKRMKVFTCLLQKRQARFPEIHKLPGCTGKIKSAQYTDKCLLKDMNTEINEFYFFHGTKPENVSVICDQGLDNRLASGSAMFGQGIYGAETPTKADQYADDQDNRTAGHSRPKQMFLMRMMLGNAFVCKEHNPHKFKRPPCVTCKMDDCRNQQHWGLFDSVVGDNRKLFREFVVYDKGMCYPEYLITYERRL